MILLLAANCAVGCQTQTEPPKEPAPRGAFRLVNLSAKAVKPSLDGKPIDGVDAGAAASARYIKLGQHELTLPGVPAFKAHTFSVATSSERWLVLLDKPALSIEEFEFEPAPNGAVRLAVLNRGGGTVKLDLDGNVNQEPFKPGSSLGIVDVTPGTHSISVVGTGGTLFRLDEELGNREAYLIAAIGPGSRPKVHVLRTSSRHVLSTAAPTGR